MKDKTKITILLLMLTSTIYGQSKFKDAFLNNLYLGFGVDPAMLANGPGHDYTDKESTFHWHAELGWDLDMDEYNGLRIGVGYSQHQEINYAKLTFLKVDYKLRNHLLFWEVKGFDQYVGMEGSIIYRSNVAYRVNAPGGVGESGRKFYYNPESTSAGINFELQYSLGSFSLGLKQSFFLAEGELIRDGKYVRDEVTATLRYKFLER